MLFCRDDKEHYLCPGSDVIFFAPLLMVTCSSLCSVAGEAHQASVAAWVLMPVRWWSLLLPPPQCLTKSGTSIASMRMTQSIFGRETCLLTCDRTSIWWSRERGSLRYCRALWVGLKGGWKQKIVVFWDVLLTFWDLKKEIYVTAS